MKEFNRWYKDRDFPEIKTSNADILAVVERPKDLQRLIDEHNAVLNELHTLQSLYGHFRGILKMLSDKEYGIAIKGRPLNEEELREMAAYAITMNQNLETIRREGAPG